MNPITRYRQLRKHGVLGLNRRNAEYIQKHNPRRLYSLVDDKVLTKKLAQQAGIVVPELYGTIKIQHDVNKLDALLDRYDDFVIKPAAGSGGNGVLVITDRRNGRYRKASGELVTLDNIRHHVSNIISGMFSIGGHPDVAIIEYRVRSAPVFDDISFRGVPDIRTIVYKGFPVMAMLRLPTMNSDGKANLHQGAIGVGIDLEGGVTVGGVLHDRKAHEHPDTGAPIEGVQIPDWDHLLSLAAKCYDISGMGYLGVDFVLDRDHGAMMLEMNARPGLAIQTANRTTLLPRLKQIDQVDGSIMTVDQRVELIKEVFGIQQREENSDPKLNVQRRPSEEAA